MAVARSAPTVDNDDYSDVVAWYRRELESTYPPDALVWDPIKIGPTWQWDDGWVLPERTLG